MSTQDSTRSQGLPDALQGEFVRLFSQHAKRLYQFILTLALNHADAEEVFQNTCVVLWKKFAYYDPQGSFYAWACRIAHLEMLALARQGRRTVTLSEDVLEVLIEEMAEGASNAALRQEALEECLRKLRTEDRALVEHRYYHCRAPKEIARAKSCSVYSVYRALARIHTTLRRCVQQVAAKERSG